MCGQCGAGDSASIPGMPVVIVKVAFDELRSSPNQMSLALGHFPVAFATRGFYRMSLLVVPPILPSGT
jgi:hypothetical protein